MIMIAAMSMTDQFRDFVQYISDYAIPVIFFAIILLALCRRVKAYEAFVEGGKEGFDVFLKILPYLVAILVAIGMFKMSGALDFITYGIKYITRPLGMPDEVVPVALMRPLSGSGSLGLAAEVIKAAPDSYASSVASTVFGSTDTTFYVIALYFGSVGVKKIRHSLLVGLTADACGILAALWICKVMF